MSGDIRTKLSRLHEEEIAEAFAGERHAGSGNQPAHQADGRTGYHDEWEFGWDCKAAMPSTRSITITRDMLTKLNEQTHDRRPMLPLRFYENERGGVEHDWVLVRLEDAVAMVEGLRSP